MTDTPVETSTDTPVEQAGADTPVEEIATGTVAGETDTAPAAEAPAAEAPDAPAAEEPAPARPTPSVHTGPAAATGRRKEAIARVRLVPGSGVWTVNGRSFDDYFPNKLHQQIAAEPLVVLDVADRYDVQVRVHGGGVSGQAGAVRLAVARALLQTDDDARKPLKKGGLLTRDARVKERRKYGLKKARKAPQYSKR